MQSNRFTIFAWAMLAYNLLIIVWGAYVRASGSGAGCGSHWPLCNGEMIPRAPQIETIVELSHRLTSGVALLGVIALAIWAWRAYPHGHGVRRAAFFSLVFMVTEALVGAGLVLFEYVAANVSIARAYWMAGHLINTFLLLTALTLTAWWSNHDYQLRLHDQGMATWALAIAFVAMLILGVSGGITALGDTLVLGAGISPESSPIVAQLVALRIYHPLLAFVTGAFVIAAVWIAYRRCTDELVKRFAQMVTALYVVQLLVGAVNVAFKAPIPIQLIHLLISDLIWIGLVLAAATALREKTEPGRQVESGLSSHLQQQQVG